jgi:hypothetical protein
MEWARAKKHLSISRRLSTAASSRERPEEFVAFKMNNLSNRGTNVTTGAIYNVASGEL